MKEKKTTTIFWYDKSWIKSINSEWLNILDIIKNTSRK